MLTETHHFPEELYQADVSDLEDILGGPTLFHLKGEIKQPLFICTLLHGNETTGFYAMQRLLNQYKNSTLPRSISYFIGNVSAAKQGMRHLDSQDDFNRIWPGTHFKDSADKDMMKAVTNIMQQKKPLASIDIHNNTSLNPHYACINILNPHGLELASSFSDIAVYFTSPKGVQSAAFSDFCPSIVLECGQSTDQSGIAHAQTFIDSVLQLDSLGHKNDSNLKLYHTVARITLPRTISLKATPSSDGDLELNPELELKNFHRLEAGTVFATVDSDKTSLLEVTSESNEDVLEEYLRLEGNQVVLNKTITLSMFTTNETAIRQDCICYLMEQLTIG